MYGNGTMNSLNIPRKKKGYYERTIPSRCKNIRGTLKLQIGAIMISFPMIPIAERILKELRKRYGTLFK